jgi:hypothetical protein
MVSAYGLAGLRGRQLRPPRSGSQGVATSRAASIIKLEITRQSRRSVVVPVTDMGQVPAHTVTGALSSGYSRLVGHVARPLAVVLRGAAIHCPHCCDCAHCYYRTAAARCSLRSRHCICSVLPTDPRDPLMIHSIAVHLACPSDAPISLCCP